MTETTTPEPEWLTNLRREMAASLGDAMKSWASLDRREDIAYRATVLAASYLRPLHAELGIVRDEYEGTETRRAELEADVRALGGDPDRMVDPRDHEAAIEAMREEMQADQSGPHIIARIAVDRARDIAERHMLRMAQASLGTEDADEVSCDGCGLPKAGAPEVREVPDPSFATHVGYPDIEAMTRARIAGLDALSVREVPAGEAREGDTVTVTAVVQQVRGSGMVDAAAHGVTVRVLPAHLERSSAATFSRPVSPLPDQPGTFGLARVLGHGDIKHRLLLVRRNGVLVWSGVDGTYEHSQVTDFESLPAGAGVDEGGKL